MSVIALMLLGLAQAATAPAQTITVVDRAPAKAVKGADTALAMFSGQDALTACGDAKNVTRQIVCVSWINGAIAGSRFSTSNMPEVMPDFCTPADHGSLDAYRNVYVAYLRALPKGALNDPAIVHFRRAMKAGYPCKK